MTVFWGGSWGWVQGVRTPLPPPPEMTCGFLMQLVFCKKKSMWFIGVEVDQETSAPLLKKNPGSSPGCIKYFKRGWWPDFVVSILVTTFVKNTRKSFNKNDSSWLFTCTRVAVKLGTTNKQINLGQASALSRPLDCVSWPFSLTASVYLLYMKYSTLYQKNAQCRFHYQV